MTTRVIAIREISKGGVTDEERRIRWNWSPRGAVRMAAWMAAFGAGGYLLRRAIRRRRRIDPGMVSEDWIAQHREVPDPFLG